MIHLPDERQPLRAWDQYGNPVTAYIKPDGNVVLMNVMEWQRVSFNITTSVPDYPQQKYTTTRYA